MSSKQLKVKVVLGEDIRRWRYPEDVSSRYLDLGKFISEAFNFAGRQFTLKYEDDENDHITMSNQRDFEDAFQAALEENRRSLKIFVVPVVKTDDKKPAAKEEKLDEPEEEVQDDCATLRALALDFISNEEIVALLPLAFTNIVKELKNCNLQEVKLEDLILKVLKSDAGFNPITQHKLFAHAVKFLPCICARAKPYIPFIINDSTNEAAIMSFLPQMIGLLRMGLLRFENIDFDIELDGRKVNVGSFIPDWFAFECNSNNNKKEDDEKVHKGITCDGCNKYPIIGARYKCSICEDFDLCQDCEAAGKHNPSHPMLKFYLNQQFHHSLFRGLHEIMKRNGSPPLPHLFHGPPPPPCFMGGRRGHMHRDHFNHHGRGGPNFHQKRDFAHRRHGRHHRHNRCGGGYKGRKWNVNMPQKNNNNKKNVEENEDKARTDAMIRLAESNIKNVEPAKKEQEKSLIALEKNIINEANDEIKKDEEEEEEEVIADNKTPIFCVCGEMLIELNGRNVICDICNKRCKRNENVYHCPKDNGSEFHRRGYDVCLGCGDIQRISLMEIGNKAKEVNEEEVSKEIEVEKKEENEEVVSDIEVEIIPGDNIPANEIDIYDDEDDEDDVPPPISSCITVVDMDESDSNEPDEEEEEEVIEEAEAEVEAEDNKAEKKDDFAYGEQLNMLSEMGFEKNDTIYALLVQKNGNVQEVITQLLR